jgi:diamine N-acetyltransferase
MRLRELKNKDAENMLEWTLDKRVNRFFIRDFSKSTLKSVGEYIEKSKSDKSNKHFAIVDENDEYMGTVSLKNIDLANENAEYAISLRYKAQGAGYAKFATQEVLKHAFKKLSLKRVYLNVLSSNARAIAFYEKTGFTYEGEFKQHIAKDGMLCDIKWYAMLKGEF